MQSIKNDQCDHISSNLQQRTSGALKKLNIAIERIIRKYRHKQNVRKEAVAKGRSKKL